MSALRIDVIEDDRSLARLEDAWTRLLAETPASSGFQSFAWVSACRSGLPSDPGALFTLVLCDGADTVAMLAIEPRRCAAHGRASRARRMRRRGRRLRRHDRT